MTITVTVDDRHIGDMLRKLQQRAANLRPVMEQIGDALREDSMRAFDEQRSPEGAPWIPLAGSTLARRRGGGAGAKTLLDTGVLRNSIGRPMSGGVRTVTKSSVAIGSRQPYAAIHQFGGMAGRRRATQIPARPFLGLSEQGKEEVLDLINAYFGTIQK